MAGRWRSLGVARSALPVPPRDRTPLYDLHRELGGRLVDFAGWALPVQYPAGILAEHLPCRTAAALFDVSHMGQADPRARTRRRRWSA